MSEKTFNAVVRHYHCADRQASYEKRGVNHRPHSYSGLLKEGHDLDGNVKEQLNDYFSSLPDGENIEIIIRGKGESHSAKGFVWAWTKPHTYERILKSDYRKMVELEKTGDYKKVTFEKHKSWLSDVQTSEESAEVGS